MRMTFLNKIVGSFTLFLLLVILAPTHAVAANSTLLKAKEEAWAKGYIYYTSHDEIVDLAKKEGTLRVISDLETRNFKPLINAFKQKYPFISDIQVEEIQGTESSQRLLLEIKAGQAKGLDIVFMSDENAKEYMPYLMKHDIFGMAKQGVFKIDPRMIHPVERNIIGYTSTISVVTYNRKLISDDKVPAKWEDFLKPEFKGKKFVADLRPTWLSGLVPAWGLERTLEFARKLATQQPVWGSGGTRFNTALAAGEYSFFLSSNFSSAKRAMSRDRTGNLSYKIIEPIPARIVNQKSGILNTADHPHAALLWLEFLASPEGQEIIDKYEPLRASVFTPGSAVAREVRGKELSMLGWDHFTKFEEYSAKIFAAYGFPKVDK